MEKSLQSTGDRATISVDSAGWLTCPKCRINRRLMRIRPDTEAKRLVVYCRTCKNEIVIDVEKGESFQSQGR